MGCRNQRRPGDWSGLLCMMIGGDRSHLTAYPFATLALNGRRFTDPGREDRRYGRTGLLLIAVPTRRHFVKMVITGINTTYGGVAEG
jgi:6-phosphogluconate dehydrogenase (decarboxylating)